MKVGVKLSMLADFEVEFPHARYKEKNRIFVRVDVRASRLVSCRLCHHDYVAKGEQCVRWVLTVTWSQPESGVSSDVWVGEILSDFIIPCPTLSCYIGTPVLTKGNTGSTSGSRFTVSEKSPC